MAHINKGKYIGKRHTVSMLLLASLLAFFFILKGNFSSYKTPLSVSRSMLSIPHIATVENVTLLDDRNKTTIPTISQPSTPCKGINRHLGYEDACAFVRAIEQCNSGSLIDYTDFFFCKCAFAPVLGYLALGLWIAALFYMLGNTAADYFCCSLEKLSGLLNCPATVAGVTLLPLGNGAPDVFASIASFVGANAGEVGLNSVLGGAAFVTTVVAGLVSLTVSPSGSAKIDRNCFIRDVCFFLFTLFALLVILLARSINLFGALAFFSIYILYTLSVLASELIKSRTKSFHSRPMMPLPFTNGQINLEEDEDSIYSPLIDIDPVTTNVSTTLPQWMWASNVAIYSHQVSYNRGQKPRPLWGWSEEEQNSRIISLHSLKCILQTLLTLPRNLTIPIVEEERWSRGFAVVSATLSPPFFSLVLALQGSELFGSGIALFMVGTLLGILLGLIAFYTTISESPPTRCLFPWVAGGFVMSIVWFYLLANELVGLLVTFGKIMEIDPSVLGLTVLAWGNSMGDLMGNIALASNSGDGLQIAMSGCYAGPMFNILAGLGISLLLGAFRSYPLSFVIPRDGSLFYTLGFLIIGLLWALVALPMNGMHPNKSLGVGLLVFYALFLGLRLGHVLGIITFLG